MNLVQRHLQIQELVVGKGSREVWHMRSPLKKHFAVASLEDIKNCSYCFLLILIQWRKIILRQFKAVVTMGKHTHIHLCFFKPLNLIQ